MTTEDEPSCPAFTAIGDGSESIDLMCWLPLGHAGLHRDERGDDEPVLWQRLSEVPL